jgi:hypothetical protein
VNDGKLTQTPFYKDTNFAVALWEGEPGDSLKFFVREPRPRSAFACLTICLRGHLQMYSPDGEKRWWYFPGSTSDDGGDFDQLGTWEWRATQPNTQEICFSALDEDGEESDEHFPRKVTQLKFGEKALVKAGCLLVVPTGGVVVHLGGDRDRQLLGPYFARVENDTELTANFSDTTLVEVRRK